MVQHGTCPASPTMGRAAFSLVLGLCWGWMAAMYPLRAGQEPRNWKWACAAGVAVLAAAAVYHVAGSGLGDSFRRLSRRRQAGLVAASVLISLGLLVVVPLRLPRPSGLRPWLLASVYPGQVLGCAWLIGITLLWALTRPVTADEPGRPGTRALAGSAWLVLGSALPCVVVWTLYHLALWPAVLSADSTDQWEQIHTLNYDDWHPASLALLFRLITLVWDSPAAIIAVQTVALAGVFGWGLVLLRRVGVSVWVTGGIAGLLALSPLNALWVNCLGKDLPFSLAMLVLSLLLFEAVTTAGASLGQPSRLAALTLTVPMVMLFRHNGVVPGGVSLLVLLAAFPRQRGRMALVAVSVGFLLAGVKLGLYPAFKVKDTQIRMQPILHLLAAHVAAGTDLSEPQRQILARVNPLDDRWHYNPYWVDRTLFHPSFQFSKLKEYPPELPRLAWQLTHRRPWVTLNHYRKSTTFLWRMVPPRREHVESYILWRDGQKVRYIDSWLSDLKDDAPKLPGLTRAIQEVLGDLGQLPAVRALWSPALRLYGLTACVVLWCLRTKQWKGLLVLVPVLSNTAALAVGGGGGLAFRFHLATHFVALLGVGLLFARCGVQAPAVRRARRPPVHLEADDGPEGKSEGLECWATP